jgi:hypothetical protein
MPVLTLAYRCCDRMLPRYIKHSEVEGIAVLARQQLVDSNTDAIALSVLRDITGLKINGIQFDLWVDTEHAVNDEHGNPVLGVCEFDPAASLDATVLSVSPVSDTASEELVLSTFAHELGHAIFDAPSWIAAAAKGPGLFDDPADLARKAYRTTTRDAAHLAKPPAALEPEQKTARNSNLDRSVHFAELRANEFMGSLLVPRQHLYRTVEELAPKHGVTINRSPSLDPESPGLAIQLTTGQGMFSSPNKMLDLQQTLAKRFGVHRRFIQVRMERYGLLKPEAGII